MKRLSCLIFFCVAMGATAHAQSTNYKTYSVFLYSFIKYIEWPADTKTGDFVIGVYGNSKMASELQAGVAGRKNAGQTIKIKEAQNLSDLAGVQLVFIGDSKSSSTADIVKQFKGQPVLIVTERDGLIKKGASVSFLITDESLLKFQINEQILAEQKLKAASALVQLAYKGS
jgi:YfiR/HmsC-like